MLLGKILNHRVGFLRVNKMPNSYCLAFCIINYEHMGLAMHSSASEEMRGYCRCSHEQRIKQKPIEEHLCRPNRTIFYAWQAFNFCKDVFLNSATISKFPKYFDSPCVVLDITTNTAPTRSSSLHLHFRSFAVSSHTSSIGPKSGDAGVDIAIIRINDRYDLGFLSCWKKYKTRAAVYPQSGSNIPQRVCTRT
jgi:hypothetical protein